MNSQLKKGMLEYCILAYLNKQPSYGYDIIKNISGLIPITESTLYPILKRLEAKNCVETFSQEYNGRLRKYYKITLTGRTELQVFMESKVQVEEIYAFIEGSLVE
ncbi:PadR family transcriptional regulator [Enterococcus sp. JM4C]|uniref:PadR family transcriptional regulator n=1 Tax=Candidatus Enterococcus huntleyi TaxID=1857217 RepID=UPI00137A1F9D|nr:PadR family transcriptional regulator [Enterococcus sp. JM4C]KAF1295645.1 PadR family transcriptional regulator [Enterococcus sp. JM4C]